MLKLKKFLTIHRFTHKYKARRPTISQECHKVTRSLRSSSTGNLPHLLPEWYWGFLSSPWRRPTSSIRPQPFWACTRLPYAPVALSTCGWLSGIASYFFPDISALKTDGNMIFLSQCFPEVIVPAQMYRAASDHRQIPIGCCWDTIPRSPRQHV